MPHKTDIEWCDYSSNPLRARDANGKQGWACVKVSSGCAHCYSETLNQRFGTKFGYTAASTAKVEHYLDEKELRHMLTFRHKPPYKNGRSRPAVFPFDMTDVFGEWNSFEIIDKIFAAFALRPDVDWLVLTKRPERMAEYWATDVATRLYRQATRWLDEGDGGFLGRYWDQADSIVTTNTAGGPRFDNVFWALPLDNVWLGCSVENQQTAAERIPHLLRCPAAVRFLSAEPLLGAVDFRRHIPGWRRCNGCGNTLKIPRVGHPLCDCGRQMRSRLHGFGGRGLPPLDGINWVIVGGESGPSARPMHPSWARSIRDQCQEAGVAFFFKQWGEWSPNKPSRSKWDGRYGEFHGLDGWVEDCMCDQGTSSLIRVGKKVAGRMLDGREWNEMPPLEAEPCQS